MAAVYTSTNFSTAAEYRRRTIEYPFRGDPLLGSVITRYYEVVSSSFAAPALNALDSEFAAAYLVGVGSVEHVDGELMRYDAKFATIPATRDEHESYAYRFPGWGGTVTYTGKPITSFNYTGYNRWDRASRYCQGHGLAVGNWVSEKLTFAVTNFNGTGTSLVTVNQTVNVTSVSTDRYEASVFRPSGVSAQFISGTAYTGGGTVIPGRGATTIVSHSRIQYDYVLPGVTEGIAAANDLVLQQPATFRAADGVEAEILTGTTTPTLAQYQASMAAREEFPVESFYRTWMGNIIERVTRWVPYQ